jgi:ketosteroid isomerase-like protein
MQEKHSIEERLARLEDERDIVRTLSNYGHSLDYGDEAVFADCWTEDAVLEWPKRPAPFRGKEAIIGAFRGHTHAPRVAHKHLLIEPLITLSGDEARVTSMWARLDRYGGLPKIRNFGRYEDHLVRCPDGRWRIKSRLALMEAMRDTPPDVTDA